MKTLIILVFTSTLFSLNSYSQNKDTDCGIWDAVILKIEKLDTSYVVTGQNVMPDCTPIGIFFEQWANESTIKELRIGMRLDFVKFKPYSGYWKYKRIYTKK